MSDKLYLWYLNILINRWTHSIEFRKTKLSLLDRKYSGYVVITAFSGLLTSTPTELTSGSSYLFLTIIITSLLLFGGLCCLRARTICRHGNVRRGSLHCRRGHHQSHSLRLPVSLFAHNAYSRSHIRSSPSPFHFSESPL